MFGYGSITLKGLKVFFCGFSIAFDANNIHIWASPWENQFLPYMNKKGADHLCSLISTFVFLCLDSIIPLLVISEI